jgi:hypothetical protein
MKGDSMKRVEEARLHHVLGWRKGNSPQLRPELFSNMLQDGRGTGGMNSKHETATSPAYFNSFSMAAA